MKTNTHTRSSYKLAPGKYLTPFCWLRALCFHRVGMRALCFHRGELVYFYVLCCAVYMFRPVLDTVPKEGLSLAEDQSFVWDNVPEFLYVAMLGIQCPGIECLSLAWQGFSAVTALLTMAYGEPKPLFLVVAWALTCYVGHMESQNVRT